MIPQSATAAAVSTETTTIGLSASTASPEGIAITPDGSKVYVVNRGNDTVDVISTATNTLVAGPIAVGSSPRDAKVTADGSKVLVMGEGAPVILLTATDTASATLLDDTAVNIDEWIAGEVEQAFATQEGTAFVSGDGSGKPTGFLNYTKVAEASWALPLDSACTARTRAPNAWSPAEASAPGALAAAWSMSPASRAAANSCCFRKVASGAAPKNDV